MDTNDERAREALIRAAYLAFNARDIDAAVRLMTADVTWPNGMEGGVVYGHNGVREYWTRKWTMIDPRVEPLRVIREPDGRVAVEVRQVVRDLAGALLADRVVRHVYTFRDGLVESMEIQE